MAQDEIFKKLEKYYNQQYEKTEMENCRKKAQPRQDDSFAQRSDEFQKQFNSQYLETYSKYDNINEGDASALYNKFNSHDFTNTKDEAARFYGSHNDGYSSTDTNSKPLDRGLGCAPHQRVKIKDHVNLHKYDGNAPKIRVRLSNSWTADAPESHITYEPARSSYTNPTHASNGGRVNGGSKLNRGF